MINILILIKYSIYSNCLFSSLVLNDFYSIMSVFLLIVLVIKKQDYIRNTQILKIDNL